MTKHCEWCGNQSGKTDTRGMCISCGGNLSTKSPVNEPWTYNDHSGSSYYLEGIVQGMFSPNEIRRMIFTEIDTLEYNVC